MSVAALDAPVIVAAVAIGFAAAVAAVRICLQLITDEESDSASE
jgi:hypothetical protein